MNRKVATVAIALFFLLLAIPTVSRAAKVPAPVVKVKTVATATQGGILVKIVVKNQGKKTISFEHSSGLLFDYELLDKNKNVLYRWSQDKYFIQMMTTTTLKRGKRLTFSDSIQTENEEAFLNQAVYIRAYIGGTNDFIKKKGYLAKIKR
ncbi:MAG: hypothetical protein PWP24_1608 [Clostridiales bacterium]|nr:hypothetical protein [Clostridiales bacterium]